MLSSTAQYTLRAMVYIASIDEDRPIPAKEIAAKAGVPSQYLSRLLNALVRGRLLTSARGVGGGFRLAKPARQIALIDVLAIFDDVAGKAKCPFGKALCTDSSPCGFHEFWKPISASFRKMLEDTTLADVGPKGMGDRRR